MELRKTIRVLGCKESFCKTENNCRILINLLETKLDKPWYFVISHNSLVFAFNSNLDQVMFVSKKECLIAAEDKLNEFIESGFSIKHDNVHTAIYK